MLTTYLVTWVSGLQQVYETEEVSLERFVAMYLGGIDPIGSRVKIERVEPFPEEIENV